MRLRSRLALVGGLLVLGLAAGARAQEGPAEEGPGGVRASGEDELLLKSSRTLYGRLLARGKDEVWFSDSEIGLVRVPALRVRAVLRAGEDPGIFAHWCGVDGAGPPGSFVRHRRGGRGEDGHLDVAVSRFGHPERETTLFLVGAVHVGEPAYYARLQEILDGCDLVLWEGVRPAGGADRDAVEKVLSRLDGLRAVQLQLAGLLGLRFQMDELEYDRDFWRNADVDVAALERELEKRRVSLPGEGKFAEMVMRFAFGMLKPGAKDAAGQKRLRGQFASVMGMADTLLARMGKVTEVLIDHRNAVAWSRFEAALEERPADFDPRWIAIFYGAAHLPDFAKRAALAGFQYQGTAWIPAWTTR